MIMTEKGMLLDKGQDGLAIFAPLPVFEEGTRLQQGSASFDEGRVLHVRRQLSIDRQWKPIKQVFL